MSREFDSQLLESVAVRRRRLRDALLFGGERSRRSADENLGKVFGGIALTAVVCAGCVGWSFVTHKLMHAQPGVPAASAPAVPSGTPAR